MINYDLEFLDLESFITLYNYQNYTKAAEKLFITQPALSRRIRSLEEELGVKLVDRSGPNIQITKAGEHFYKQCLKFMAEKDSLYTSMNRFRTGNAGVLRIGLERNVNLNLALKGIVAISQDYPEIKMNFETVDGSQTLRFLRENTIDVVYTFLSTVEDIPELSYQIIAKNTLHASVGRLHPFFERSSLSWKDLIGQTLCLPNNLDYRNLNGILSWAEKSSGVTFGSIVSVNSNEELIARIATGECISFAGDYNPSLFDAITDYVHFIPIREGENRIGWPVIAYATKNRDHLIQRLLSVYDTIMD